MDDALGRWWRRSVGRRFGPHGEVWRARDRLERTLDDIPDERRLAFADVLPGIDHVLTELLPQLHEEATFLQRYLRRVDPIELRQRALRWEREAYRAEDAELRAVRERNLALAREQLERVDRLEAALARYRDQVSGLALAIDEAASRIAASRVEGVTDLDPELRRLRSDIELLAGELAELHAGL